MNNDDSEEMGKWEALHVGSLILQEEELSGDLWHSNMKTPSTEVVYISKCFSWQTFHLCF